MEFTKMHGCANDYVYLDCFRMSWPENLPELARRMSDRHCGIGGDGIILIGPSHSADFVMRMFNADGSESEMCGNGLRCAAKLAYDHGHISTEPCTAETGAGILSITLLFNENLCIGAEIAMGEARFAAHTVPFSETLPYVRKASDSLPAILTLTTDMFRADFTCVGMGNPHAVCFVDDCEALNLATIGPDLEHHKAFPQRSNIEFVTSLVPEDGVPVLRQRTFERGSGETMACGTGACAVAVAAIANGVVNKNSVIVRLNGGDLQITWDGPGHQVIMRGPAISVFTGEWPY